MNLRMFDGPSASSPALVSRVRERVDRALRHVSERIVEVRVWFADTHAGRSGHDTRCRIVAQVARRSPIVVESCSADAYRAADVAAGKLRRAVEHRLGNR